MFMVFFNVYILSAMRVFIQEEDGKREIYMNESVGSSLHDVIEGGDYDKAYYCIYPHMVSFRDHLLRTPLHCSCLKHGKFNRVSRRLIRHDSDINAKDYYGRTPLHHACFMSNYEMIIHLLSRGGNPSILDNEGHHCMNFLLEKYWHKDLHYRSFFHSRHYDLTLLRICRLLVQNGFSYKCSIMNIRSEKLAICLYDLGCLNITHETLYFCMTFDFITLAGRLARGLDHYSGRSLLYACGGGYIDVVKALLDRGAEINPTDGNSPLFYSYKGKHTHISVKLLEYGGKLNSIDYDKYDKISQEVIVVENEIRQRKWDRCKTFVYLRYYPSMLSIGVLGTLVDRFTNMNQDDVFNHVLSFI